MVVLLKHMEHHGMEGILTWRGPEAREPGLHIMGSRAGKESPLVFQDSPAGNVITPTDSSLNLRVMKRLYFLSYKII